MAAIPDSKATPTFGATSDLLVSRIQSANKEVASVINRVELPEWTRFFLSPHAVTQAVISCTPSRL